MIDLSFLSEMLDGDGNIDWNVDLHRYDLNKDGIIDRNDCPAPNGSSEAKLWIKNIFDPYHQFLGTPKDNLAYLTEKLQISQGFSFHSASRIAQKILSM